MTGTTKGHEFLVHLKSLSRKNTRAQWKHFTRAKLKMSDDEALAVHYSNS